jgi:uncharacterized protein YqjF (DUF2071 family)
MMKGPPFLTARWNHLVMLNYAVDPAVLQRFLPAGTELDVFAGRTFLSVVGFRFWQTRVLGCPIPGHTDFEEVNLRFYVRRRDGAEIRRGVVFIREIVPRPAIAWVARVLYGEPYIALPMKREIRQDPKSLMVQYSWRREGRWNSVTASAQGEAAEVAVGSEEEFITEHYWGYTAHPGGAREYQVEHPRWRTWRALESRLDCDVAELYGREFVGPLSAPPSSAFIADGSAIQVRYHARLPAAD